MHNLQDGLRPLRLQMRKWAFAIGAILAAMAVAGLLVGEVTARTDCATDVFTGNATAPSACATDDTVLGLSLVSLGVGGVLVVLAIVLAPRKGTDP